MSEVVQLCCVQSEGPGDIGGEGSREPGRGGGERKKEPGAYVLAQDVLVGSATSFLSSLMPEANVSEVWPAAFVA